MRRYLYPLLLIAILSPPWFVAAPAKAAELVFLARAGCAWCARFEAEIAPIYPKTQQGELAPLRRVDVDGEIPNDLRWLEIDHFTPTFVIVEGGREVGRLRGYAGDEFFWFLLEEQLAKLRQKGV